MDKKLTPHEQKKQREKAAKAAAWNKWQKDVMNDWQWYRFLPEHLRKSERD